MNKVWYESKTLWVNLVSTAIATVSLFVEPGTLVSLGLSASVADHYQAKLLIVLAVLNILLRAITQRPLTIRKR